MIPLRFTAAVIPLRHVAPNTEAALYLERAYHLCLTRAQQEPTLDNMRRAVEAYDAWVRVFLGVGRG